MLNVVFTAAVEWDVIETKPCVVRLVKVPRMCTSFHDFVAYERLIDAASSLEANACLVVLLGGEAGLRCGEMLALQRDDVNLATGQLTVERSEWKGHVTTKSRHAGQFHLTYTSG